MRRANCILVAIAIAVLGLHGHASAQSRGIEVALKASEAPDAAVLETVRLYGASHALVIGIDEYTNGWPRLSNGVNDARAVAAELESRGFEVTLRTEIDSVELKRAFEEFYVVKGENPEARLFVWFSGHGATVDGEAFLVPADAPPPQAGSSFKLAALSLRRFGEFVRLARSKHALAVFDSCFAGTIFDAQRELPPPAITRATTLPVRQFLTSGDVGQSVSDDGTFRKLFLRALRGEERANGNRDDYLTASELGLFLSDRMVNLRLGQTPRYGKLRDPDFDRGDFVFVLPDAEGGVAAAANEAGIVGVDMQVWDRIEDSTDAADFVTFIESFPASPMVPYARNRLKALSEVETALVAPPEPEARAAAEEAVGVYPETFKDCPECPEMVVIPPGEFVMGSPESETTREGVADDFAKRERPRHSVRIGRPFALGKTEVTRAEFAAFVRATGHEASGCEVYTGGERKNDRSKGWRDPGYEQTERDPVACVSWDDAKAYLGWLSRKTGKSYRFPRESEWEYAARAGTTTARFWGEDAERGCGYANAADLSAKREYSDWPVGNCDDGYAQTAPVGAFAANAFGVHDMLGNVWEWTEDCWNGTHEGAPTDGAASGGGDCRLHVLRGGSWVDRPGFVRAASRGWNGAEIRYNHVGFRVARTLD